MTTATTDPLITKFLQFMSIDKEAAENTVDAYRNDLIQLHSLLPPTVMNGSSTDWQRVTREIVISYIDGLKERRYAEATVARKVAAMKSFFVYLYSEGIIRKKPTESLASPHVSKILPKPLTMTEVDDLLGELAKCKTPEGQRDWAMIELLYATGIRITELVSLNVDSVRLNVRHPHIRCIGKGAKKRKVPIHDQALKILATYINSSRKHLVRHHKQEIALFVNYRGGRMSRQGFWLILNQHAHTAEIETEVTSSTLRHSFAVHMLKGGMPVRQVQELLGHSSISTTQIYEQVANN